MEIRELIELYDQDQRIESEDPRYRREVSTGVVRQVPLMPDRLGFVTYSHLDEENADVAIRAQIDHFTVLGIDFEWKLYDHDTPPDLKERLHTAGFIIEEAESIMVLDLDQAPIELLNPAPTVKRNEAAHPMGAENIEVRRITEPDGLAEVIAVEEAVWKEKMEWIHDHLGSYLRDYPELLSVYVAYIDGAPASAAWVFYFSGSLFASLWGGATLSSQRGKGLYSALLAVRIQEAIQRRRRFLVVDASAMSRPILEKYNFRLLDYSTPCKWQVKKYGIL
jgi:hypothetical protein